MSRQIPSPSDAPGGETLKENMKSTPSFWRFRGNVLGLEYMPNGGKEILQNRALSNANETKSLEEIKILYVVYEKLKGSYSVLRTQTQNLLPPLAHLSMLTPTLHPRQVSLSTGLTQLPLCAVKTLHESALDKCFSDTFHLQTIVPSWAPNDPAHPPHRELRTLRVHLALTSSEHQREKCRKPL